MRDPVAGRRPKDRPLDYYLPPSRLDLPQPSSWQPPGVSPTTLSSNQATGKFLSAADMYRQESSAYAYTAQHQQHPYSNASNARPQAPRPIQPARSLATTPAPQNLQPPTSTTLDPKLSQGVHSQADTRRSPHFHPVAFPTPTLPPPRQGHHVQTDLKRPLTSESTNRVADGRPSLEDRLSLSPPRPRQRTISQPGRDTRRPSQASPPPLPQPDPFSIINPSSRRANYPNPNDPFSVVGPRGYPLKQTKSNNTESSHKWYTHACVSL